MRIDTSKFERILGQGGIEIAELAELTKAKDPKNKGVSRSQLYLIQKEGKTTKKTAWKMANALGVDIEDLLPEPPKPSTKTVCEVCGERDACSERARNVFNIAIARARHSHLSPDEIERVGNLLERIIELLTVESYREREKNIFLIEGILDVYKKTSSQPTIQSKG